MITLERAKGLKAGDILQFQSPAFYTVSSVVVAEDDVYVQLKSPNGGLVLVTKYDLETAHLRGSTATVEPAPEEQTPEPEQIYYPPPETELKPRTKRTK